MQIELPSTVQALLAALQAAGFDAFVVGGCVRDSLLGRTPGDWDICTAATPQQVKAVFAADRLLLAGEKHGTVAVLRGGRSYEITTFRLDGGYSDNRRPDSVTFVPDVERDLARRDFTVNAMACSPAGALVDVYGGRDDLAAGVIRCVGDARERFREDALRILRALRFAAQLDFTVEEHTAAAALELRDSLQNIAAERLFAELDKLLAGPAAGRVLASHGAILAGAIPEIAPCLGCAQGPGHIGDVWQHTAAAVGALPAEAPPPERRTLLWTLLLHDLAKPACRSVDKTGRARFPGHNRRGAALAGTILRRLRAPAALITQVPELIAMHDMPLPADDPAVLRLLARCGPQTLRRLVFVKQADLAAHAQTPAAVYRRQEAERFRQAAERLQDACYTTQRLHVNGADALAAGIPPGPAVGRALRALLERVMDGALPNERGPLLAALDELALPPAKDAPHG